MLDDEERAVRKNLPGKREDASSGAELMTHTGGDLSKKLPTTVFFHIYCTHVN